MITETRRHCAALPRLSVAGALVALAFSPLAQAAHGLLVTGFGAESLAMAGTDIAVSRDTAAVNINPAGLTQIPDRGWDLYASPFDTLSLGHKDQFGNDATLDNPIGSVVAFSYAQRLRSLPDVVVGTGLFAQGGTGFRYDRLNTAFGTRDELTSIFGVYKLDAGLGWSITDRLSLGVTIGLSYGSGREKLFPNTSDASAGFFGLRFDGGKTLQTNTTLGLQYRISPELKLGMAYTSKTRLPLKDATVTVNYEAVGDGRVKYDKASLTGLALPQTLGAGLAWQLRPDLLLAFEAEWVNWSDALKSSRLRASDPQSAVPAGAEVIDQSTPLGWYDQYALSVGAAWTVDDRNTLLAGYDRVRNPVPRNNSSPLLNIVQRGEFTLGYQRALSSMWKFAAALQYETPQTLTYTNPNLPFGSNSQQHYELFSFTLSIGRRW